jgi:Fe-S cluster assembly protein SufD
MFDGLFLYVPKNVKIEKPIQCLFISTQEFQDSMQHLRNLIIVEENSQVTLFETYVSETEKKYFNNIVTQIYLGNHSQINYYKYQQESENGYHIANTQIHQQANSCVNSFHFSLGSQLAREDLAVSLNQSGAECALYGLYLLDNRQHIDHHTRIDHHVSNCTSYELYKGILAAQSVGVFNGKIIVHPQAQRSNAQLVNQNLLLAKTAEINTKPELEIYADDVKCSHGATVGQIDDESLFYLRSRGIEEQTAQNILTYAFASEVINQIKDFKIKEYIINCVKRKFTGIGQSEAVLCP